MKGQSQLVTAVLLTGILIVLVSAAYFWGVPLIEKQKDTVTMNNMERLMKDMDEKIERVAASGGRERIENVDVPGELRLADNGYNDEVSVSFKTTGQIIATGSDIYLSGDNRTVVPITSNAGALKAFSEAIDGGFSVELTLAYRETVAGSVGNLINLKTSGRDVVGQGTHDITIVHEGVDTIKGGGSDGRDLNVVNIVLRFE
ncbi:MAG: hypothetical protein HYS81_04415 [Candidatus Aenigmatarchaeota archaeon]|nr:MAG: hypothetical protein HYS81_04415 [Candidatus Aenigmarchaeota archaeon]